MNVTDFGSRSPAALLLSSIHASSDSGVATARYSTPKRTSGSLTQRPYVAARSRRSGPSATRSPVTSRSGSVTPR